MQRAKQLLLLIVPMLLVFGLGWPAALTLWKRHVEVTAA